jgi:hypothetical protein
MPVILGTNEHYTLMHPDKAEILSNTLNGEDEDGWTYEPVHDPKGTGYSYINVYDSTNELLGKL